MARYIDVDPILKDMCSHRQHSVPFEYLKSLTPARVVPAPRWISVKERLPERNCEVLAYYGFVREGSDDLGYMCMGVLEYYAHDRNPHFQHESVGVRVTHWMPLPEPPEEVE